VVNSAGPENQGEGSESMSDTFRQVDRKTLYLMPLSMND